LKPAIIASLLADGSIKRRREAHVKTCPDCNGEGVIEKDTDDEQQCPRCGGSGFVPDAMMMKK
jgi:DnaJ-class molecular chaperone